MLVQVDTLLSECPQGTFGRAYGNWLMTHNFSPDERKPVIHIQDPDLAYVPHGSRDGFVGLFDCCFTSPKPYCLRLVARAICRFVMKRYRQVHDFWHILCGVGPSVLGEVAIKWFEMVQTGPCPDR